MDYILAVSATAGITIITVLGLHVIFMTGQFQGGQAAFMGLGAYVVGISVGTLSLHPLPAVMLAVGLTTVVAFGLSYFIRRLRAFYLAVATLSFGQVVVLVVTNVPALGGALGLFITPVLPLPLLFGILALLLVLLWRFGGSKHALMFRASVEEDMAAAFGIDVAGQRRAAFVIGCAIASLGGSLQILYYGIIGPSEIGFFPSLLLVIYVAFGGLDTVLGSVLGVAVLIALQEVLRDAASLRFVLYGAAIVVLTLVRPRGLVYRTPLGQRAHVVGWLRTQTNRRVASLTGIRARSVDDGTR